MRILFLRQHLTILLLLLAITGAGQQRLNLYGTIEDLHGRSSHTPGPVIPELGIILHHRNTESDFYAITDSRGRFQILLADTTAAILYLPKEEKWRVIKPERLLKPEWSGPGEHHDMYILVFDPRVARQIAYLFAAPVDIGGYQVLQHARDTLHIPDAQSYAQYRPLLISLKDRQVGQRRSTDYLATLYASTDYRDYTPAYYQAFRDYQLFPGRDWRMDIPQEKIIADAYSNQGHEAVSGALLLMKAGSLERRALLDSAQHTYQLAMQVDPRQPLLNAYGWFVLANKAWEQSDSLLMLQAKWSRDSALLEDAVTATYQQYRVYSERNSMDTSLGNHYARQITQQATAILNRQDPYLGSILIDAYHHLSGIHPIKQQLQTDQPGYEHQQGYLQKAFQLYNTFQEARLDSFGVWTSGKSDVAFDLAMLNSFQPEKRDSASSYFTQALRLKRNTLADHPYREWLYLDLKQSYTLLADAGLSRRQKLALVRKERKATRSRFLPSPYRKALRRELRRLRRQIKGPVTFFSSFVQ